MNWGKESWEKIAGNYYFLQCQKKVCQERVAGIDRKGLRPNHPVKKSGKRSRENTEKSVSKNLEILFSSTNVELIAETDRSWA